MIDTTTPNKNKSQSDEFQKRNTRKKDAEKNTRAEQKGRNTKGVGTNVENEDKGNREDFRRTGHPNH